MFPMIISVEEVPASAIISGELAADMKLTEKFVQMGVDELSAAPPAILPLREKICNL